MLRRLSFSRRVMLAATYLACLFGPRVAFAAGLVVVIKSDDLAAYEPAVQAFVEDMGKDVGVWSIQGSKTRAQEIAERLKRNPPSLIFALGAKAAWTAIREFPDTPVVYGMVRDPERYGIVGRNVTGVRMDLPAETVLSQIRLFAPNVNRIGVIIGESNPMGEELVRAARATGLELQIRRVQGPQFVRAVYARLSRRIDALWIINDPKVLGPENFRFFREQSRLEGIPIFASSETLVKAGALLAVIPDYRQAGHQAAMLARKILEDETRAGDIAPVPPEGMRVVLNRDTLQSLGMELDPMLLDFTDEVISESKGR